MPTDSPSPEAALETRVFWLRFQKEITAALIVLTLAMAAYAGYRFYAHQRNGAAAQSLGKAKSQQEYQEVIDHYSGTPAGASAYLPLAGKKSAQKKISA